MHAWYLHWHVVISDSFNDSGQTRKPTKTHYWSWVVFSRRILRYSWITRLGKITSSQRKSLLRVQIFDQRLASLVRVKQNEIRYVHIYRCVYVCVWLISLISSSVIISFLLFCFFGLSIQCLGFSFFLTIYVSRASVTIVWSKILDKERGCGSQTSMTIRCHQNHIACFLRDIWRMLPCTSY